MIQRPTLLSVTDRQCRWIDGKTDGPATVMCGERTRVGAPYCDQHTRKSLDCRLRDKFDRLLAQLPAA